MVDVLVWVMRAFGWDFCVWRRASLCFSRGILIPLFALPFFFYSPSILRFGYLVFVSTPQMHPMFFLDLIFLESFLFGLFGQNLVRSRLPIGIIWHMYARFYGIFPNIEFPLFFPLPFALFVALWPSRAEIHGEDKHLASHPVPPFP